MVSFTAIVRMGLPGWDHGTGRDSDGTEIGFPILSRPGQIPEECPHIEHVTAEYPYDCGVPPTMA